MACLNSGLSRRAFLQTSTAALATTSIINIAEAQPVTVAHTPDAALKLLIDGNERYVANQPRERDFSSGRASRAAGQAPFAAILGCVDSRIAPELAFDQGPGDLFVVRVAGNFVTTDGLASLEFGAAVLGTKLIMVLGHSSCGAVLKQSGDHLEQRAVIANVRHNVERASASDPYSVRHGCEEEKSAWSAGCTNWQQEKSLSSRNWKRRRGQTSRKILRLRSESNK